ncbi:MAG: hypothetical protein H6582_08335 [Crocinitomicaceae bacterium]|nr:hypothetical protein [Crocinitomicaceae bacterium]
MHKQLVIIGLALTFMACGGSENDNQNNDETNHENDTTSVDSSVTETIEVKEYVKDLSGIGEISLDVVYDTWAEGTTIPITIEHPGGEEEEYELMNPYAHLYQYDGTGVDLEATYNKGEWYVDSLWEDGGEVVVFKKGTKINGPFMTTAITREVYAEPNEESELIHTFKNESYSDIILAWKNWVKISFYTPEKNMSGWVKTRPME